MNVSEFKAWFEGYVDGKDGLDKVRLDVVRKKVTGLHELRPEPFEHFWGRCAPKETPPSLDPFFDRWWVTYTTTDNTRDK